MSVLLFAMVLIGFSPTLYLRSVFDVPKIPAYLFLHGAVLTAWYAWFVVQTYCVAIRRTDLPALNPSCHANRRAPSRSPPSSSVLSFCQIPSWDALWLLAFTI